LRPASLTPRHSLPVPVQKLLAADASLVPDYGALMSWRIVLLAVALCLWIAPQLKGYQPAVPLLSVSFILLLAGELIGRGVFYGLHMTVGMAVAS
ncbi:DmsC/YnfH family molybdoenzyme membrane anchor subunit, partial [Escherichia sp. TWPC-MK]